MVSALLSAFHCRRYSMKMVKHKWKQLLVAVCVGLGETTQGLATAFPSSALPQMMKPNDDLYVSQLEASIIAAIFMACASTGNLSAGFLMDLIGRQRLLLICAFPTIAGYILIAVSPNITSLICGRALIGLTTGMTVPTGSVYISEIAEADIRGSLSIMKILFSSIGHLLEYIIGACTEDWRLMTWISLIVPVVYLISMLFLPETPRYLLMKKKRERAFQTLMHLRKDEDSIKKELLLMETHMKSELSINLCKAFSHSYNVKVFIYALFLGILYGSCGGRVLFTFAEPLSKDIRTYLAPNIVPIILGLTEIVGELLAFSIVEKSGRRLLLQISGAGMCLNWCSLALYCWLLPPATTEPSSLDIIPLTLLIMFTFSFTIGYRCVKTGLAAELLPLEIRGVGTGANCFIGAVSISVLSAALLSMISTITLSGTFLCFAFICFISFWFPTLFIPETKGKTLEEIESLIKEGGIFMGFSLVKT